jgi:hypothetical protein
MVFTKFLDSLGNRGIWMHSNTAFLLEKMNIRLTSWFDHELIDSCGILIFVMIAGAIVVS